VSVKVNGDLSCVQPKVTLNALTSSTNVLFNWAGPKGFSSDKKNPEATDIGNYTLKVTDPVNGCISQANATVKGEECVKNKN